MLKPIKQNLPEFIKQPLKKIKLGTYDRIRKKQLVMHMAKKHGGLINDIKSKEKVKVVFLVLHKSVWKVDTVFRRMLDDPYFEPEILVCPFVAYGEDQMLEEMAQAYEYFKSKGYPVKKSLKEDGSWLKLSELEPDIVFFTNPHNLTRKEYYELAYENYLSCYVPYFYLTTTHGGDRSIYNHLFHNAMWKIYMPHDYSIKRAFEVAENKARNCTLTGYPFCEELFKVTSSAHSSWKYQDKKKKKIIFAPHHTIEPGELELSNFLAVADMFTELAVKFEDSVQWAFKPHPILKMKLYLNSLWGKDRTNAYYDFWKNRSNTQLEEGEYVDLFIQSDAIIHDCGSFLVEYLLVEKPCAYLNIAGDLQLKSINEFGHLAMESYRIINKSSDVEGFVLDVISGINITSSHRDFIKSEIIPLFVQLKPSEMILKDIKASIIQ